MFRVLLDVDGVSAKLVEHLFKVASERYPEIEIPSIDDIQHYRIEESISDPALLKIITYLIRSPRIARDFPLEDLRIPSFVKQLKGDGIDVKFCTAPYYDNPTWVADRFYWLIDNFKIKETDVIFTDSKHLIKGDVLVDDSPYQILSFAKENGCDSVIVYDRPWNRKLGLECSRAYSWDDVMALIYAKREQKCA